MIDFIMLKSKKYEEQVYKIQPKTEQQYESYAISPDDQYLAIVVLRTMRFNINLIAITEVQIVESKNSKIVQIIMLPNKSLHITTLSSFILRFSNDSKQLYIGDRDNIFFISTTRKQTSKFKARDSPIQNILELKHKIIMIQTYNKLKILRKNKIVKKMKLDNYDNEQLAIDYNPHNYLILIGGNHQILIISINTLQILCVQPVKYVKNALFLQNDIITLQKSGDLHVWEIYNQQTQYSLIDKQYQNFHGHHIETMLKFEISPNQNFIILCCVNDILILDSDLQLIEKLKIISSKTDYYYQKCQQSTKRKVSYFDFKRQAIIFLPIFDQNT